MVVERGRVRVLRSAIATSGANAEQRARGFVAAHAQAFGGVDPARDLTLLEEVTLIGGGAIPSG